MGASLMVSRFSWLSLASWFGMVCVLFAYFLVSFEFILVSSFEYHFLNLIGAFSLGLLAFRRRAYPLVVLNGVWLLISLVSLFHLFFA